MKKTNAVCMMGRSGAPEVETKRKLSGSFILIALALCTFQSGSLAQSPVLMRFPNASANAIVFEADGTLWTVARAGGNATRLPGTSDENSMPRYSPDGKWIAYTGVHGGTANVFIVPAAGGAPRQLTSFSKPGHTRGFRDNLVLTWTPDGHAVVFLSRRMSWNGWLERPFSVGLDGGLPQPLPIERAGSLTYSPDGRSIAVESVMRDFEPRKRYNGGQTQTLSMFNLQTHAVQPLAPTTDVNTSPMWVGRHVYFLSDRDAHRRANLWVQDLDSGQVRELTHFTDYDIDFPSYGAGLVTFQQGGKLWSFDVTSEHLATVQPKLPTSSDVQARPRTVSVASLIRTDTVSQSPGSIQHVDYALSPSGTQAAFSARGDIFLVPVDKGEPRDLTASSTADEDHPAFSADGRSLAYTTDRDGEEQVAVRGLDGGPERIVTHLHSGPLFTPVWSPDGGSIAVPDAGHRLWLVALRDRSVLPVAFDPQAEIRDPAFSPDSAWLAFSTQRQNALSAIHLYNIATKHDTVVSLPTSDDFNPVFSPDGRYLFFVSRRHAPEISSESQRVFARVDSGGVYAATLDSHATSPFDATELKSQDTPGAIAGTPHMHIDFAGLMDRVTPLPMPESNVTSLDVRGSRVFYRTRPLTVLDGAPLPGETATLHVFDLPTQHALPPVEAVSGAVVSSDGSHVLSQSEAGAWQVLDIAALPYHEGALDTTALKSNIDPRREWGEMFERVWRLDRDLFFDKSMDGVNWRAIHDAYGKWLPLLGTREDLSYLLTQMQGELASSHMVVGGGDSGDMSPAAPPVALLGADLEVESSSGRYRFKRIYQGDNSRPAERNPLTAPGLDVHEGDYLLAINGRELEAPANPYSLLSEVKSTVTLTISRNLTGSRHTIRVNPLRSETALRQQDWISREKARVDALSGGRLAYVFLSDMGEDGAEQFASQYFPQIDKQGLIIDVRYNRGGYLSPFLVEMLSRTVTGRFINREGGGESRPREVFVGPKVCLMNEFTTSDGEQFAYFFRRAGLGQLVGERTGGSLRGIAAEWDLLDGGGITLPFNALYDEKGKPLIENHGVDPDVEVDNSAEGTFGIHDRQLETAVAIALKELSAPALLH